MTSSDQTMTPEGSAHGRFQPFHNEHLEYVLAAKRRCEFLWIGITQFDVTVSALNPLGSHREQPVNNPLTYYERIKMITAALLEEGLKPTAFGFIPFPIETSTSLPSFLPLNVLCFTTICEDWNRKKIVVLKDAGYRVEVLWERAKQVSGAQIRSLIAAGDDRWRSMVPKSVAAALDNLQITSRLAELRLHSPG